MRMEIELQALPVPIAGLPPQMEGQRLLALSDLHMHEPGELYEGALRAARAAKPHLILLLGDLIDEKTRSVEPLRPLLAGLCALAPVAAVNGNNDAQPRLFEALCALYDACGVKLLQDETCDYSLDGAVIRIIGVQEPEVYALNMQHENGRISGIQAKLAGLLPPDDGKTVNVVLVHRPERAREMAPLAPKLIVAGHAHGGQFRAFGRGLYAPGQGLFPKHTSGVYDVGDAKLAVCRGLGNHAFVPRINNPPHMLLMILQQKETDA